jgi:hypothetical protein
MAVAERNWRMYPHYGWEVAAQLEAVLMATINAGARGDYLAGYASAILHVQKAMGIEADIVGSLARTIVVIEPGREIVRR